MECLPSDGAFVVFRRVIRTGRTGRGLADLLLDEAGVSVLARTAFGSIGIGHIRLSYANSRENLSVTLEQMRGVLESIVLR